MRLKTLMNELFHKIHIEISTYRFAYPFHSLGSIGKYFIIPATLF